MNRWVLTGMVRLLIGNGSLTCEQGSVTLYQINYTYNSDLLELFQILRNAELHDMEHFNI